jgi:peptide/nickel transport system permease protein
VRARHPMLWFLSRRIVALVLLLIAISFVIFSLLYLAPGSAVQVLLGARQSSPALVKTLEAKWHLNEPFLAQYLRWLGGALHFDFGESIRTGQSVVESIAERVGITVFLIAYGFAITVLIGVPLGVVAALRKKGMVDRGVVGLSVLGVSTPSFVVGIILIDLFGVSLKWLPTFGAGTGFADRLWHLTLPALAVSLIGMALVVKITRAAMIAALDEDFIGFARARGLRPSRIILGHALRNAMIPIVTAAGTVLAAIITGTIVVEATFALPGLGTLLIEAVDNKDMPILQGVIVLLAAFVILVNLAVDVAYVLIDPRIRFGGQTS